LLPNISGDCGPEYYACDCPCVFVCDDFVDFNPNKFDNDSDECNGTEKDEEFLPMNSRTSGKGGNLTSFSKNLRNGSALMPL
jgi:hypothetical protein